MDNNFNQENNLKSEDFEIPSAPDESALPGDPDYAGEFTETLLSEIHDWPQKDNTKQSEHVGNGDKSITFQTTFKGEINNEHAKLYIGKDNLNNLYFSYEFNPFEPDKTNWQELPPFMFEMIKNNLHDVNKSNMNVENKRDICFGGLGNGITVFDRLHEKNGDYEIIAHIDSSREIKFYTQEISEKDRKSILDYAIKQDPTISATQNQKVFLTRPNNNSLEM